MACGPRCILQQRNRAWCFNSTLFSDFTVVAGNWPWEYLHNTEISKCYKSGAWVCFFSLLGDGCQTFTSLSLVLIILPLKSLSNWDRCGIELGSIENKVGRERIRWILGFGGESQEDICILYSWTVCHLFNIYLYWSPTNGLSWTLKTLLVSLRADSKTWVLLEGK